MSKNIHYTSPSQKNKKAPLAQGWAVLLSLFAGAIFSFALAPYHYWFLAFISPAILYFCVQDRTPKQALIIGWVYGFGLWFVGAFWLYTSIHIYGHITSPLAVAMVAVMALLMAIFSAVQLYVYRKFFPHTPMTFAPIWVIFEWLKTWVFTGFPWLFVGYAFTEHFFDAYAPILGVLGISFVIVFLSATLIHLLKKQWFWAIPSAIVLLLTWAISYLQFVEQKNATPLTVSLIQGNIDQNVKWDEQYLFKTLGIYSDLSETEWGRDLVVWPESAIPSFQTDMQPFLQGIGAVAQQNQTAWLTGIFYLDSETQQKYNGLISMGANTSGIYLKQRLVPFGEYIPLSGLLYWVLPEAQKDVANGSLSAGQAGQQPIKIKDRNLAVAICYEVAYPNITRKNAIQSDALMTISNDAWFTGTTGPWQHLQMVQMRAKENGRWFIRATNTGITAIINPQGYITQQVPQDVATVLRGELPSMTGRTLYNRLGDYPIMIWSILLLLISLRYRKK